MTSKGIGWHSKKDGDSLTAQEKMVLKHVFMGQKNQEIADALRVAERTISGYLNRILSKLGLKHERELFVYLIMARKEIKEGKELV